MEVDNELLDQILKDSGGNYYYHKEGTVILIFESGISKVEPGEEDSVGRIWNPPLADKQGNPILDFQGNPKEPWAKFEARVIIDGVSRVYGFSGVKSSILKNFVMAMKRENISNDKLPGTKWSIERVGRWDWNIKYLGREGDKKSSSSKATKIDQKIIDALKVKKDQSPNGLSKSDVVGFLALVTTKKTFEIEAIWKSLIDSKLIQEKDNKVFIL